MVTPRPSCLTSPGAASSRPRGGFAAGVSMGLFFKERVVMLNYMHTNHIMVTISVAHLQINLVTVSVFKVA